MVVSSLVEFNRYLYLHPQFGKVLDFLKTFKFDKSGERIYIEGDKLIAIPAFEKAKTKEMALLEAHNRYIDIQICLEGNETFGWRNRADCNKPDGVFNNEKDIIFYEDSPSTYFELTKNQFAIFFPEDCHAPLIGTGEIKKIIFKVEL